MPVTTRITTVQVVAEKKRRSASELRRIARRAQQVTKPAHSLDDVDAELPADAADKHLDGVGVAIEVLIVEMLDQLAARDHAAGVVHEIGEQAVLVRGELDRVAVHAHAAGAGIEAHRAAIELALGVPGGAPQQRADARQHLLQVEGLGDVVVGAGVEALDLVAPAVAGGENEHRHGATGAAPGLEHRDAVHLGQADVEDDRVIGLALAEKVALLAVVGAIHHVARVRERGRELPVEIGIVLDHEETQGSGSSGRFRWRRKLPESAPRALLCHYIGMGGSYGTVRGGARTRPTRPFAECAPDVLTLRPTTGPGVVSGDFILETENLTKEFAGFVAVNDIGLRVKRGTIHALIGPNGAGKTTCFNLLTKFMRPTRGRIVYKGRDITPLPPAEVARLGLVRSFQISAVFPHLSVLENVRVALQRKRGSSFDFWRSKRVLDVFNDRAMALIDDVGLSSFAHWTAVELPYGRKRALEIATTLALEPEMLLLDEPMAGMGHEDIDRISALIKSVAADRTVLM